MTEHRASAVLGKTTAKRRQGAPSADAPAAAGTRPGRQPVRAEPFWSAGFLIPLSGLIAAVIAGAFVLSPYELTVLAQIGIFAIVILGLNVLVGLTGQISFGHNAFLGIGAYLSALATTQWGFSPLAGVAAGVAVSAVLGIIIGYPTLRLRGHYLALATFALGLGFYRIAVSSPLFNGFMGIAGIPPFSIAGFELVSLTQKYLLVWTVTCLAVVATWRLAQLRFGRALRSIAADESAAQAMGINVRRYKVIAFVISGIYASVAGSLYAHTVSFVSPETFGFHTIVLLFVMLFVGGLGTIWGSLFGAAVGIALPSLLQGLQGWTPSIFALIVLIIVMTRPRGLFAPLPRTMLRRGLAALKRGGKWP